MEKIFSRHSDALKASNALFLHRACLNKKIIYLIASN